MQKHDYFNVHSHLRERCWLGTVPALILGGTSLLTLLSSKLTTKACCLLPIS